MKKYFLLILALAIGSFLRLYQLSTVPNGLTWDEAAIGYNAYSILKTGRDEHGAFLPVIFKSFGDYKPGAYIYLTVPSVAIFGLNEFAVRFPAALFGIFSIFGVYLLVNELFSRKTTDQPEIIAQIAALMTACSPWLVHFSHGAWETNVFVSCLLFGVYFFVRFVKDKSTAYPTLFLACVSLAMYQGAKLLVPLVYLLLLAIYYKDFLSQSVQYLNLKRIIFLLPFILFGCWIYIGALFGSAGNRLSTLSIFNYKPKIVADNVIFHNQKLLTTQLVISRYSYYFSPEVLFYEGVAVSERAHLPGLGLLNPIEIVFILAGLVYLAKEATSKQKNIVLGMLLISPIPASLTLAEYSPLRSLFMAFPWAIISALGIYYLLRSPKIFFVPFTILYTLCTIYIFDLYIFHSQAVFAKEFNYGYKQAVQIIKDNPTDTVLFTDVLGQPYIYYLFYTQYDPITYQKNNSFIDGGLDVGRVGEVGNVQFHQFGVSELNRMKDTMFVGSEGNIDNQYDIAGDNVSMFKQIETPDHKIIFRVIKTKP